MGEISAPFIAEIAAEFKAWLEKVNAEGFHPEGLNVNLAAIKQQTKRVCCKMQNFATDPFA